MTSYFARLANRVGVAVQGNQLRSHAGQARSGDASPRSDTANPFAMQDSDTRVNNLGYAGEEGNDLQEVHIEQPIDTRSMMADSTETTDLRDSNRISAQTKLSDQNIESQASQDTQEGRSESRAHLEKNNNKPLKNAEEENHARAMLSDNTHYANNVSEQQKTFDKINHPKKIEEGVNSSVKQQVTRESEIVNSPAADSSAIKTLDHKLPHLDKLKTLSTSSGQFAKKTIRAGQSTSINDDMTEKESQKLAQPLQQLSQRQAPQREKMTFATNTRDQSQQSNAQVTEQREQARFIPTHIVNNRREKAPAKNSSVTVNIGKIDIISQASKQPVVGSTAAKKQQAAASTPASIHLSRFHIRG